MIIKHQVLIAKETYLPQKDKGQGIEPKTGARGQGRRKKGAREKERVFLWRRESKDCPRIERRSMGWKTLMAPESTKQGRNGLRDKQQAWGLHEPTPGSLHICYSC